MSKGSARRPQQISQEEMDRRWEMAFKPRNLAAKHDHNKGGAHRDRTRYHRPSEEWDEQ